MVPKIALLRPAVGVVTIGRQERADGVKGDLWASRPVPYVVNDLIMGYIKQNPQEVSQALTILSMIRRLERVGDQAENIAEEIIFYIEAKVIKHTSKKEKRREDGE